MVGSGRDDARQQGQREGHRDGAAEALYRPCGETNLVRPDSAIGNIGGRWPPEQMRGRLEGPGAGVNGQPEVVSGCETSTAMFQSDQ
jgi:hypothetical protein